MSKIIEKRRMCQKISTFKKRILYLDSIPPEKFECTTEYKSEVCRGTDYVSMCIFNIAAKNIKFARKKMQRTKEIYLALVCLANKLKCAYMSVISNHSDTNIAFQQSVIDGLESEYESLIRTTFRDVKLFQSEAIVNATKNVLLVGITNLISVLKFNFQNYGLSISITSLVSPTPDVDTSLVFGSIFLPHNGNILDVATATAVIPTICKLIDHFVARLAVIENVFNQLDSTKESLENKLSSKIECINIFKNNVLERLTRELELLCHDSDRDADNCNKSDCFVDDLKSDCHDSDNDTDNCNKSDCFVDDLKSDCHDSDNDTDNCNKSDCFVDDLKSDCHDSDNDTDNCSKSDCVIDDNNKLCNCDNNNKFIYELNNFFSIENKLSLHDKIKHLCNIKKMLCSTKMMAGENL
jgi:hypothetical protein